MVAVAAVISVAAAAVISVAAVAVISVAVAAVISVAAALISAVAHISGHVPPLTSRHRILRVDHISQADRILGTLHFGAVISAAIGTGVEGFITSTTAGGMHSRGGLGATATTITGLTCALCGGDITPTGTTAACTITASIDVGL